MLIVEFRDNEEQIYQQMVEWLSLKFSSPPTYLKPVQSGFSVNPNTRVCTVKDGDTVYMSSKEFDLLYFLYCHKGQVFTKKQIFKAVYEEEEGDTTDNIIYCLIRSLRKKLEPDPRHPRYIHTVRGIGYKFEPLSEE